MSKCVLDASAILALLFKEPGNEALTDAVLEESVVSTVNLAEIQTMMVRRGVGPADAWARAILPAGEIVPFTQEQARVAGSLVVQTRPLGLSLADRACLALALDMKARVYTADRSWKKLNLGVSIHLIR